ncbi:MAG: fluoride efflux transporter CrcB [Pseudomonadota bacterium]
MMNFLLVGLGGAIGAMLRHLSGMVALRLLGPAFPWGTLFVNVFGSLIMGLFIAWLVKRTGASNELRLFVATGILGGFTTFSAFSLDVANLFERGEIASATGYILISVLFSIAAVFAGLWFGRALL